MMNAPSPRPRTHRILGGIAILHAAIIGGVVVAMSLRGWFPSSPLWVAFATLWLSWPIVLLVHPGRSLLRVAIPMLISLPLLGPAVGVYRLSAPLALGFPPGVSLSPRDIRDYFVARRAGRTEAEKDLNSGVLAVESYGFPLPPEYAQLLRDRFQVQLRTIAGDTNLTAKVLGHAEGYNKLSKAEIRRRFGDGVLEAAEDESLKHWREKEGR